MVKASDLVIKGIASPYQDSVPSISCYKQIDEGIYIPCRFNSNQSEYKDVSFPEPKLELRTDQLKVLEEMEAMADTACVPIFGHIYTGFGKSAVASVFGARRKGPILIFCDRDAIRQGWIGTWRQFYGIEPHVVTGDDFGQHDVCIMSIQLAVLHQFPRSTYAHYKTVICDEADTLCTQLSVNVLLDLEPKYFIGITATIKRSDGMDKVLDIFWGPRNHWIRRVKEFDDTCHMHIKILHTPFQVPSLYNRRRALDWMSMIQHVANIEERNIMVRNLCIMHMNRKILVLTKSLDHVSVLHSLLAKAGIDATTYCSTARTYYDAHVLVATISKAGRGYDDRQVSAAFDGRRFDILILCMTMKDTDQALGRGLRGDNLLVYILVDDHPTMKNHAMNMRAVNSKRGATVSELHI